LDEMRTREGPTARRRALRTAAAVLGVVTATGVSWPAAAMAAGGKAPQPHGTVRVIVGGATGREADVEGAVRAAGGHVLRRLQIVHGVSAEVPAGSVTGLSRAHGVVWTRLDAKVTFSSADPALGYDPSATVSSLTHVGDMINANAAYNRGFTGKGVDVALLDSGIAPVPGLDGDGKVVNGADLSLDAQSGKPQGIDGFGHGTAMASIIGSKDGDPGDDNRPSGIAPDARLVNVKVGAADGSVDVSQVIAGIDWVVTHRRDNGMNIRVLNLSFGTDSSQSYQLDPVAYAAEQAWRSGIVVVAAVGNAGATATGVANPAADPFLLAVGATDPNGTVGVGDDTVASYSSLGSSTRHADLLAPGTSVVGLRDPGSQLDLAYPAARIGTRFFRGSGTSQATAVVSGAVALLLQQRPNINPDRVKQLLMATDHPIKGSDPVLQSVGLVDMKAAMSTWDIPTLTPVPGVTLLPGSRQGFEPSKGMGSLDAARGTHHLVAPDGAVLNGERDLQGKAWTPSVWAPASAAGTAWNGGTWNGSAWTGSAWTGSAWTGSAWTGSAWTGSAWTGSAWTGSAWTGSAWTGSAWTGSAWTGSAWTGSAWTGSAWTGSAWSDSLWG